MIRPHRLRRSPARRTEVRLAPWATATAVTVASLAPLAAQEALRGAVQGDQAYEARRQAPSLPETKLSAGPVRLDVALSLGLEWSDNVNISEDNPEADVILRPRADVRALWPVTEQGRLRAAIGVGYNAYLGGKRANRLLLDPGSEIAYDFRVEDVLFTLYDRFEYTDDVITEGDLSGETDYTRLINTVGLRVGTTLGDWLLQAGYGHFTFLSISDNYQYLDRGSEQFFGRTAYLVAAATQVGVEASGSMTAYDEATRSDFNSISLGPYAEWSVTQSLRLSARGGYVLYDFVEDGAPGMPGDVDSFYAALDVRHDLTEAISHRLRVARGIEVGIQSDYVERLVLDYQLQWKALDRLSLALGPSYETVEEPDTPGSEDYDRWSVSAAANYELLPRFHLNVSYRWTEKDSDAAGRSYQQNRALLGFSYRL